MRVRPLACMSVCVRNIMIKFKGKTLFDQLNFTLHSEYKCKTILK